MNKITVLVVDDSAFMRKVITDIISLDKDLHVIATARNGKEAIQKIKELKPDVVTLDIEMPIMDGLAALEKIMEQHPIPVVMLSSLTKESADATLKALSLGAVDFIPKPENIFKMHAEDMKKQLNEKIRTAAKVLVKKKYHAVRSPIVKKPSEILPSLSKKKGIKKIIAIGTSTGGPRALQYVIPYLPKDIPASILIVQHMPAGFTKSLAERLNNLSAIHVKEAEDGDVLLPGHAYIAPGNYHMKLTSVSDEYVVKLTQESPVLGLRPSVDVMMNSVAELGHKIPLIGVIMTGMGSDGAEGMKNIKNKNGLTIAQSEETCVVYGMPKSAIDLGCIDEIVPLHDIASKIITLMEV